MNLEIKEKYDNFIRVIEKKEKIEWLEQNNNHNKYIPDLLIHNEDIIVHNNNFNNEYEKKYISEINNQINCDCNISSGYTSYTFNSLKNSKNSSMSDTSSESNDRKKFTDNKPNYIKNKNIQEKDLSLLDDDFEIRVLENKNNNFKNNNEIKSEFKNIFNNNLIKENSNEDKNENSSIKNKLEKIYNKMIEKNKKVNNSNNKNINNYELIRYLDNNKKNSQDDIIKKLTLFCEKYIFEESTRGWNFTSNVYIINFVKLLENLKKIIFIKNHDIVFGFFYRDYLNPKTSSEKDFTKYWIGYENSNEYSDIKKIDFTIKNKILYYSFKNLSKSSKFKKRIGKTYYKIFKKTVQVIGDKDLIIDLIFYVGLKNV